METARQQKQIPSTMRAFVIDSLGETGAVRELPTPEVGAADFLIRVRAAGVNPLDWKIRDGKRSFGDLRFPYVLGQDAAGEIVQVGRDAKQFKVGDEVYGSFWLAGTYAQYVRVTDSTKIARKPKTIDFAHAAGLPIPGLTALAAVNAVGVKSGETILIVGATGGVGGYIVQLAAQRGAQVIATARDNAQAHIRKLGATEVIDYTNT
ncbi:MAG TPA: NADP-dependent oxidoreductase, partial [Nitrospiraceae bacterium]|nr:NADP-dependent oxidoreductase [Nitrospiraceae bacterium]